MTALLGILLPSFFHLIVGRGVPSKLTCRLISLPGATFLSFGVSVIAGCTDEEKKEKNCLNYFVISLSFSCTNVSNDNSVIYVNNATQYFHRKLSSWTWVSIAGDGGYIPSPMSCIIIPPIFHGWMPYYSDKISEIPTKIMKEIGLECRNVKNFLARSPCSHTLFVTMAAPPPSLCIIRLATLVLKS